MYFHAAPAHAMIDIVEYKMACRLMLNFVLQYAAVFVPLMLTQKSFRSWSVKLPKFSHL